MPLCLTFIDLKKAFDSVETEAVIEALCKQGVSTQSLRSPCNIFIALISMGDILHMLGHYVMIISHNVKFAIGTYKSVYIAFQALSSALFATAMVVWIILERDPKKKVVCVITAPIIGAAYQFFLNSGMTISILMFVSYAVFLCFVRKVRIKSLCLGALGILLQRNKLKKYENEYDSLRIPHFPDQDNMRHIYRSLIIISLSTVFGWFSTVLIAFVGNVLHLQIDRIYVSLLAGLFVNCACACNFFVYYTVSTEYRRIFDYHLCIGRFKRAIGFKVASVPTEQPPASLSITPLEIHLTEPLRMCINIICSDLFRRMTLLCESVQMRVTAYEINLDLAITSSLIYSTTFLSRSVTRYVFHNSRSVFYLVGAGPAFC
ncbi:unnamed protein product [Nippostrongylus brasiliensis]|uniref:G protein-coupled receptor n=1 Tax=Nippostrongylus brasiliensis TaxID=27835 RepID=A0A0N4XFT1_NIPBR|nr:unnamed protein product [Nippostrongylus brasiliensis]